jgi:hypothetical protein
MDDLAVLTAIIVRGVLLSVNAKAVAVVRLHIGPLADVLRVGEHMPR